MGKSEAPAASIAQCKPIGRRCLVNPSFRAGPSDGNSERVTAARLQLYRRRLSGRIHVQTGQVVDELGVLTVKIVRLDVQLDKQYC